MSTHPNAILLLVLKPDGLARKTYRDILAERDPPPSYDGDPNLKIGGEDYHVSVMESDYDEGYQIGADEGDILVFDMITYGYGEKIEWAKLEAQKAALAEWATGICERHNCTAQFFITANYW